MEEMDVDEIGPIVMLTSLRRGDVFIASPSRGLPRASVGPWATQTTPTYPNDVQMRQNFDGDICEGAASCLTRGSGGSTSGGLASSFSDVMDLSSIDSNCDVSSDQSY
jgi:hypothetical protein